MDWEDLMRKARLQATLSGQRTKVVGRLVGGRMAKVIDSNYLYTILIAEYPWERRCGVLAPIGKPCIKKEGYSHGVYHLCRELEPGKFTFWTPTDRYGHPTRGPAYSYELHPVSADDVKEMGLL